MENKIISFITELLSKNKINLIEISFIIFVSISIIIMPINLFSSIKNAEYYKWIILVWIISGIFLLMKLVELLIEKLKKYKSINREEEKIIDQILGIDNDSLEIIYLYYNSDTNKFNTVAKILPTELGVEKLENMKIISFNDYTDECGGYSMKEKQLYQLDDKYRIILNKMMVNRKNNYIKEFILNKKQ